MAKLTGKQQRFVEEYLIDMNATQASIRAGYSEKTAGSIGTENLSKPVIAEALQKAHEERSKRTEITADMVLTELAKLAFFDIRGLYDDKGQMIPIHDLPAEVAAAIGGIDITYGRDKDSNIIESETAKVKVIDKKGSLELIGRHLKMWTDKKELTGANGEPLTSKIEVQYI